MSAPEVTVSIVSHGHDAEVRDLLTCIARHSAAHVARVALTLNIPEPGLQAWAEGAEWPFELRVFGNSSPRGFGANHNAAFAHCATPAFCVLNPDIRFEDDPLGPLLAELAKGAGCAYPRQVDAEGRLRASARAVPAPLEIIGRRLFGRTDSTSRPQFAMGFFLLLRAEAFQAVRGFDENYFMYCEDVDLSIRLQLAGWRLAQGDATVTHVNHAASHRNLRHLAWHVSSLLRLWRSPVYAQVLRRKDAP